MRRRLELARRFRADALIATQEQELVEAVMNLTAGRGVDIAVTACASPEAQEQALAVIAPRGRVNYFGGLPRGSRAVALDSNVIHYKECCVHGSHGSVPRQHRVALDLPATGQVRSEVGARHALPVLSTSLPWSRSGRPSPRRSSAWG